MEVRLSILIFFFTILLIQEAWKQILTVSVDEITLNDYIITIHYWFMTKSFSTCLKYQHKPDMKVAIIHLVFNGTELIPDNLTSLNLVWKPGEWKYLLFWRCWFINSDTAAASWWTLDFLLHFRFFCFRVCQFFQRFFSRFPTYTYVWKNFVKRIP